MQKNTLSPNDDQKASIASKTETVCDERRDDVVSVVETIMKVLFCKGEKK